METIRLTEDNIDEWKDFVDEDMAETIGRTNYDGVIVTDEEEPVAGMIWTLMNTESDEERAGRIVWLRAESSETFDILFDRYDEVAADEGLIRSELFLPAEIEEFVMKALKKKGFFMKLSEGDVLSITLSEIANIDFMKEYSAGEDILPLRSVTQRGFNEAVKRMIDSGRSVMYEDLATLPRLYFENDVSCCAGKDGEINGLLLFHLTASGNLETVLMSAAGEDYEKLFPRMMVHACKSAMEKYGPDTRMIINSQNNALFPKGYSIPMYKGSRDEEQQMRNSYAKSFNEDVQNDTGGKEDPLFPSAICWFLKGSKKRKRKRSCLSLSCKRPVPCSALWWQMQNWFRRRKTRKGRAV